MAYPYEQKKKIVETVAKLVAGGLSFTAACKKEKAHYTTVADWLKTTDPTETVETKEANELKRIYENALNERFDFLNDLATDSLTYLLKNYVEETETYEYVPIKDGDGNFVRDKEGRIMTEGWLSKLVRYKKAPLITALQLHLTKRHPDYKETDGKFKVPPEAIAEFFNPAALFRLSHDKKEPDTPTEPTEPPFR